MKKLLLINAVIWAVVILVASYLFKGTDDYALLFGILLVAAGLENAFICTIMKKELQPK